MLILYIHICKNYLFNTNKVNLFINVFKLYLL